MIDSDNFFHYDLLYSNVEDVFRGHGQDIVLIYHAPKDSSQPWGTPELFIPTVAVLIWILETAGRTIIEELVKKAVAKEEPDAISKLENRVRQLELLLEQLLAKEHEPNVSDISSYLRETVASFKIVYSQQRPDPVISPLQAQRELSACLERIGFTHRTSKNLADQIIRMLPPTILEETHEDA